MIKNITESDFIKIFSKEYYVELMKNMLDYYLQSEGIKYNNGVGFVFCVFEINPESFIYKKIQINNSGG